MKSKNRCAVFVASQPKSGTYLLGRVLSRLGLKDLGKHFSHTHFDDYSNATQREFMTRWEDFRRISPFAQSIQMVAPGSFGVGHISPTDENIEILKRFQVFALRRELRSGLVSLWRFETERTSRFLRLEDFLESRASAYIETAKSIAGWEPHATLIRFEDLIACSYDVSVAIGQSLSICPDFVHRNLETSLREKTKTESSRFMISRPKKIDDYWSSRAELLFSELGGPSANNLLGYS